MTASTIIVNFAVIYIGLHYSVNFAVNHTEEHSVSGRAPLCSMQ